VPATKALPALAIVVAGALAAFAIYTFGWHEAGNNVSGGAGGAETSHVVIIRDGDVVRDPRTGTVCQATGEAGVPNLFCTHGTEAQSRFQAVLWADRADLYDVARHGEPMLPTYSVPAELKATKK
jgi:hypothetical protein